MNPYDLNPQLDSSHKKTYKVRPDRSVPRGNIAIQAGNLVLADSRWVSQFASHLLQEMDPDGNPIPDPAPEKKEKAPPKEEKAEETSPSLEDAGAKTRGIRAKRMKG